VNKATFILVSLLVPAGAAAQVVTPPPVISPLIEYGTALNAILGGSFVAYASGAVEDVYYNLLATNNYLAAGSHPSGECYYFDSVKNLNHSITEQVVGYRGSNTFAVLHSTSPAFTRLRTVSPCFNGSSGELTEQQHRTGAYGGGSTVVMSPASSTPGKAYETVNRTRIRWTPTSTSPYELASTGAEWQAGDFDQIFIGARESLYAALNTTTSTSGVCRGELNPPAAETCSSAFVWKLAPLVKITDNLVDPVDGQLKTFTALPPLLAEYDTSTVPSLPLFSNLSVLLPVVPKLFGFMEFGSICTAWGTPNPSGVPPCLNPGFPSRLAAVIVADTSSTTRPTQARLYYKKGASWVGMNADGTFPSVPDDFAPSFGMGDYSDVKFDPLTSTWKLWGSEVESVTTTGCNDDKFTPTSGSRLAYVNLATYAKTTLWGTVNGSGRMAPIAHYVFSSACNCQREFIFYSSTDYVCYNVPRWNDKNAPTPFSRGLEVVVRRTLDGPPN